MELKRIAVIHTDFPEKFGIPRQSTLVPAVGRIVFEPEYRAPEALRGIQEYSHLWLLWEFSEVRQEKFHPTVRPPRLGGNRRVGVFATRSPFRPNPVGLSCVRLLEVELTDAEGPVLYVEGVDLMDGTPIYDIKPYLPYTDSHPDASGGFAEEVMDYALEVDFPPQLAENVPAEHREILTQLLAQDPRPSYQEDPERLYGMTYAGLEIRFTVDRGRLSVRKVEDLGKIAQAKG